VFVISAASVSRVGITNYRRGITAMSRVRQQLLAALAILVLACNGRTTSALAAGVSVSAPAPAMCCNPVTGICVPATVTGNVGAAGSSAQAVAQSAAPGSKVNLDLSSRLRNIAVSSAGQQSTITIREGGTRRTVSAGALLTAAELIAVNQVLTAGHQSIRLGLLGNAIGGRVSLNSALSQQLGDLLVPRGVTAIRDFSSNPTLSLAGNLTNAGRLFAVSTNPAITTATISAASILNLPGGLISSVLPAGGLSGFTNAIPSLSLNLTAATNFVNQGTISSSRNLTLSAGGSISNQGTVTAAQNVNLVSAIGSFTNSGLIAATAGNINVTTQTVADIVLQNTGGTLQALNGAINFRDPSFADKANLSIIGGDLLSRELNLYSGTGIANLNVGEVSGVVNAYANEAHVTAATDNLQLGTIALTGDPTFFNLAGDVTMGSFSVAGPTALAVVASGDINVPGVTLSTAGGALGGDILLVAGAQMTRSPAGPSSGGPDGGTTFEITGASSTGGNLNISGSSTITSSGVKAGNITLIAFAGSGTGNITMSSTSSLLAQGSGGGSNGDIKIIADGTQSGIQVGHIDATGGASGGTITISTATPTLSGGAGAPPCPACIHVLDGAITDGSFGVGSVTAGHFHSLSQLNAAQQINIMTGDGGMTLDAGVLANRIGLTVGSKGILTVNSVVQSTGSNIAGDTIKLSGGTIVISGTGHIISFNGGQTDVPVFFTTDQLTNNGGVNTLGDIHLQSFSGAGSMVVDGTGSLLGNGPITFSGIVGTLSFSQGQDFGQIDVSALTNVHQFSFSISSNDPTFGNLIFSSGIATDHVTGSSISLSAGNFIRVPTLDATGSAGNNGGTITATAPDVLLTGTLGSGASADASGPKNAGTINITTTSADPFVVCGAVTNGTQGEIFANGFNGGTINLTNNGGQNVSAGCQVTANGTGSGGTGGTVFLGGSSPLNVTNAGTISATNTALPNPNTSGIVAISAGPNGIVNLNNTGTIQAGKAVKVGNVNPTTLKFTNPKASQVNITSSTKIPKLQAIATNLLPAPPAPPAAAPVLVALATPTSAPPLLPFLQANQQAGVAGGQDIAKIATDQTPVNEGSIFFGQLLPASELAVFAQTISASVINTDVVEASVVSQLLNEGVQIRVDADADLIALDKGNIIVHPEQARRTYVGRDGTVLVDIGSWVLIMETGNDMAVYDLQDTYKGAVRVIAGKKEIVLTPGKQVVLTRKPDAKFDEVNPGSRIAYRNVRSEDVGDGVRAFAAEFSIPSAMTRVEPLRQMLISKKSKDSQVARKILRNAALISMMTGPAGPYKSTP